MFQHIICSEQKMHIPTLVISILCERYHKTEQTYHTSVKLFSEISRLCALRATLMPVIGSLKSFWTLESTNAPFNFLVNAFFTKYIHELLDL